MTRKRKKAKRRTFILFFFVIIIILFMFSCIILPPRERGGQTKSVACVSVSVCVWEKGVGDGSSVHHHAPSSLSLGKHVCYYIYFILIVFYALVRALWSVHGMHKSSGVWHCKTMNSKCIK